MLLVVELKADPDGALERGPAPCSGRLSSQLRLGRPAPRVGHVHRLQAGERLRDARLDLIVGEQLGQGDLGLVEVDVGTLARGAGPPVDELPAYGEPLLLLGPGGRTGGSQMVLDGLADGVPELALGSGAPGGQRVELVLEGVCGGEDVCSPGGTPLVPAGTCQVASGAGTRRPRRPGPGPATTGSPARSARSCARTPAERSLSRQRQAAAQSPRLPRPTRCDACHPPSIRDCRKQAKHPFLGCCGQYRMDRATRLARRLACPPPCSTLLRPTV